MDLRAPALLLLLVPLLAAALLAARRSALGLSRGRLLLWGGLRALLLVALGLVVADARAVLPSQERAVVFALDVSESISPTTRTHLLEWIRRAWAARQPTDRAGLVVFGSAARVEHPLSEAFEPAELHLEGLPRDGTAIDQALRSAGGLLRAEPGERRVVLLSDGNSDGERAATEAMALASAGIQVTTVAVELTPSPREVLVEDVSAPQVVAQGEPFLIKVQLRARSGGPATLHLVRSGGEHREQRVDLQPGTNLVTLQERVEEAGVDLYEVTVAAEGDADPLNNSGGAIVRVRGRPRALLVQSGAQDRDGRELAPPAEVARPLRRALEAAGFEVRVGGPSALPTGLEELSGLSLLVLGDVGAERWSEVQMEAVRRWVHDQGGGLLALGGSEAFGLGGYYRTPVEEALPVSSDVRSKKVLPSLALVLCIDRSGSMLEVVDGGATRLDLAKEGALRALDLLQQQDWLGVIAFAGWPEWVVRLNPVLEKKPAAGRILGLESGGGTAIAPALREAHDALASAPARLRHAVLLTDGRSGDDPSEVAAILRDYRTNKITLTTVGVGAEVDRELLRGMADQTGGRYLHVQDARTLPRLLAKEAVSASKALAIEREVKVRQVGDPGVHLEWASAPPLRGFVMTVAKPEAEVLLDSGPEDGPEDGPLLVRWRYGLGKTAAFTSDAAARWSAPWLSWDGYPVLFGAVARWVARDPGEPGVSTAMQLVDGRARVLVRAVSPDGAPLNGLTLRARPSGPPRAPELDPQPLIQTGPGEYEASFPAAHPGAWFATVELAEDERAARPVGSAGAVLAYPREYRDLTHDPALLERVARVSRGEVLSLDDAPERVFGGERVGTRTLRPLAGWLLVLAGALLVLDLAARRLVVPEALQRAIARWRERRDEERAAAGAAELLDRLRAHKDRQVSGRQRARREAGVPEPAPPAPAAAATATLEPPSASQPDLAPAAAEPAPPPRPAPPPPTPPSPPAAREKPAPPAAEDSGGMARLLRAKREAREGQSDRNQRP